MDNSNKIIIVTHNHDRLIDVLAMLSSKSDSINIAKTFSTDINQIDVPIKQWKYYMDNDNLYLAYKNNALLATTTNKDQISEGITKEEAITSNVLPMTYGMFNTISPRLINGITIAWIDSTSFRDKKVMRDTFEFMKASKKYNMLYFTDEDQISDITSFIYRYIFGDQSERERILKECN